MENDHDHDHDHAHSNEEQVHEEPVGASNNVIENTEEASHAGHAHSGENLWETTLEITFGVEHMFAEFFWNVVFLAVGFAVSKAVALRKIHKYIDDKHGVTHQEKEY